MTTDIDGSPFLKFFGRHILFIAFISSTKVHKNFQKTIEKIKKLIVFMDLSEYLCNFGAENGEAYG